MPTDLKILAAFVVLCSLLFAAVAIAELQRFTDQRPPARHRRRLSKSEYVMEAREIIYTAGYVFLGMYLIVSAGFGFAVAGLHRLDARHMRKFWGGRAVHN